jgi:hypothetical protein
MQFDRENEKCRERECDFEGGQVRDHSLGAQILSQSVGADLQD